MGFTVSQSLEQNPRNLTEFENREEIIFEIRSIESIGEILFLGGEFRNSVIVLSFDKITCRTGERKIERRIRISRLYRQRRRKIEILKLSRKER